MSQDTWYFAYGSNMSRRRKEARTGTIREQISCRLVGYRLAFNKRANGGGVYANVVRDDASEVWGVAYLCDQDAMKTLDRYEGVANGHYERATIQVENADGKRIDCTTYIAGDDHICPEETPTPMYLKYLIDGARYHGLPSWYVEKIRQLGTRKYEDK